MTRAKKLKAPFPWFGGKSAVAATVWERLGDVDNFIEPFAGSAAVLLARPTRPKIETVNDADCYVSNFWRATAHDPEAVAGYADFPVNEADLHARHRWLVLSEAAAEFRQRMRTDPDYYDARFAGWWCWGLCCWIGSGWCNEPGAPAPAPCGGSGDRRPAEPSGLQGVHARGKRGPAGGSGERSPLLGGGDGQLGHGVHAKGELPEKRPRAHRANGDNTGGDLPGVHAKGEGLSPGRRPAIDHGHGLMNGVVSNSEEYLRENAGSPPPPADADGSGREGRKKDNLGKRPTLACGRSGDKSYGGQGVHADKPYPQDGFFDASNGTCAQRRAWLVDWFGRLRDRLRTVRVCCGDWARVCTSESVTTRLGLTGVFLDPPYSAEAGRKDEIYSVDSATVAHDVRAWCLERGQDKQMRIALCGYAGEGHEELEAHGWSVVAWKAAGGYGNRSEVGKANANKERLWFSPHCVRCDFPLLGE